MIRKKNQKRCREQKMTLRRNLILHCKSANFLKVKMGVTQTFSLKKENAWITHPSFWMTLAKIVTTISSMTVSPSLIKKFPSQISTVSLIFQLKKLYLSIYSLEKAAILAWIEILEVQHIKISKMLQVNKSWGPMNFRLVVSLHCLKSLLKMESYPLMKTPCKKLWARIKQISHLTSIKLVH